MMGKTQPNRGRRVLLVQRGRENSSCRQPDRGDIAPSLMEVGALPGSPRLQVGQPSQHLINNQCFSSPAESPGEPLPDWP